MPASKDTLGQLHQRITERYLRMLEDPDITISPGDMSTMVRFLKDNEITCEIPTDPSIQRKVIMLSADDIQKAQDPRGRFANGE